MKCPVQLARDLSAGGGWKRRHSAKRRQNAETVGSRLGADGESTRCDFAGHGKADHVVASGRDSGDLGPQPDGLFDRRKGKPSPKRVPLEQAEEVLRLYQEKYTDLNVRHFHEKLGEEHGIGLSYTWVKLALQGAGLVKRGRKRGVHRKRRPRRPLPGMLLHLDGSEHRWFQDDRWYDLIEVVDDATSET